MQRIISINKCYKPLFSPISESQGFIYLRGFRKSPEIFFCAKMHRIPPISPEDQAPPSCAILYCTASIGFTAASRGWFDFFFFDFLLSLHPRCTHHSYLHRSCSGLPDFFSVLCPLLTSANSVSAFVAELPTQSACLQISPGNCTHLSSPSTCSIYSR